VGLGEGPGSKGIDGHGKVKSTEQSVRLNNIRYHFYTGLLFILYFMRHVTQCAITRWLVIMAQVIMAQVKMAQMEKYVKMSHF